MKIVLDEQRSVVTVPLTALQAEGKGQFVWVKDAQGGSGKANGRGGARGRTVCGDSVWADGWRRDCASAAA